jgi:hypothetical protein
VVGGEYFSGARTSKTPLCRDPARGFAEDRTIAAGAARRGLHRFAAYRNVRALLKAVQYRAKRQPPMNDEALAQIIEKLAREHLVGSVRLKTVGRQSKSMIIGSRGSKPATNHTEYIQTSKGQRFFESVLAFDRGRTLHRAAYCDGRRCAEVRFHPDIVGKPEAIWISRHFLDDMANNTLNIPFPLNAYYVGPKPLIEVLPTGQHMPPADVVGRPCDVFLFRSVGPTNRKEDFVYHLDKQTSVPLKVACYIKPEHVEIDRPFWAWEATSFDAVDGHHVPLASTWTRFVVEDASRGVPPKVNMTVQITVARVEFEREFPESTFWPAYSEGVRVSDEIRGESFQVPITAGSKSVADPIRVAVPPGPPWGTLAGGFLTFALIAAAIAMRGRIWRNAAGRAGGTR